MHSWRSNRAMFPLPPQVDFLSRAVGACSSQPGAASPRPRSAGRPPDSTRRSGSRTTMRGSAASTPPCTTTTSKNGARSQPVSVEFRAPSALWAGKGKREAPQRTPPAIQLFSVTGRSGIFAISEPALDVRKAPMPFPVPRCCGDCARTGGTRPVFAPVLRRVPVRRVSRPPHTPGRKNPA